MSCSPRQLHEVRAIFEQLDGVTSRLDRLVEEIAEGEHAAALWEASQLLSRASGALEPVVGGRDPAQRSYRQVARLGVLTIWPEQIPTFPLLGVRTIMRDWWRPSMQGRLLALHGGQRYGGLASRTARPLAIEREARRAREAGATVRQLRTYERAAHGLLDGWPDLRGQIKVVLQLDDAERLPSRLWLWRIARVHTLATAVAVGRHPCHRGVWRLPRHLADAVYAQLPPLDEAAPKAPPQRAPRISGSPVP